MLRGHNCQLETIGFEEASYVLQININSHKLTEINIKEVFYFNKKGLYGKNVYYLHLKKGAISSNILKIVLIFCRKSRIFSLNAVWLVAYKRSNGLTLTKKIFGEIITEHFLQIYLYCTKRCLAKKGQPNCDFGQCRS